METIFFFGSESKFGFLSNFFPINIKFEGNNFYTSEQLFMYFKAIHFGDAITAKKLLTEPNPKKAKQLGRKVKPFDPIEWDKVRDGYMKKAIMEKFFTKWKIKRIIIGNQRFRIGRSIAL